jgi:hypothetical protein
MAVLRSKEKYCVNVAKSRVTKEIVSGTKVVKKGRMARSKNTTNNCVLIVIKTTQLCRCLSRNIQFSPTEHARWEKIGILRIKFKQELATGF